MGKTCTIHDITWVFLAYLQNKGKVLYLQKNTRGPCIFPKKIELKYFYIYILKYSILINNE